MPFDTNAGLSTVGQPSTDMTVRLCQLGPEWAVITLTCRVLTLWSLQDIP